MASVTTDTPIQHSDPTPRRKISQQAIAPWLFLLPAFLFFALYVIIPIVQSFYISFYEWNGLYSPEYRAVEGTELTDLACTELGNRAARTEGCEPTGANVWTGEYVGWENYQQLWNDPFFWTSLQNNVIWLLLYFLAIPGGLFISLFLNQKVFGMRLYKSLFFFPFVLSQVVVGLVFSWFYLPNDGLLNQVLIFFGFESINILGSNEYATYGIIAAGLWPQTAYCMILYLTGLNAVDPEQIEAARLDGAKGPKMLWYVVLPQLWPATFIAIVVTVIGALRSFDLITIMTNGGPGFYNTSVLAFYMYDVALSEFGFRMGYGSAIAVILFLIMMVYIAGFLWKMWRDEKGA
ncbi:carbohydrate ABC transporter permease [Hasllibacter sp. MH4015]|uniref:carbohydrate ABC transporter permease n=1 Tax=Hasllibacter sp. MH4015 TaxID=2854029 RepID=UPI001CD7B562|nr:sugar ABC transporter permease [Hasllibacter sp. MH4015]